MSGFEIILTLLYNRPLAAFAASGDTYELESVVMADSQTSWDGDSRTLTVRLNSAADADLEADLRMLPGVRSVASITTLSIRLNSQQAANVVQSHLLGLGLIQPVRFE